MTNRYRPARSNRKIVALVLASALPSKAWVLPAPTPTTHHTSNVRLRVSSARPLSRRRACEESIHSDTLIAEGGSLIRPSWEADLTGEDLQMLLDTAQEAARAAGKVIVSHLGC
jgi:hypothetical protein